jgi:hypothetical protein
MNNMEMVSNSKNLKEQKRQIFINKFIEKFPKAKLHTITDINKYYNNIKKSNIELKEVISFDDNIDNMILEYLLK